VACLSSPRRSHPLCRPTSHVCLGFTPSSPHAFGADVVRSRSDPLLLGSFIVAVLGATTDRSDTLASERPTQRKTQPKKNELRAALAGCHCAAQSTPRTPLCKRKTSEKMEGSLPFHCHTCGRRRESETCPKCHSACAALAPEKKEPQGDCLLQGRFSEHAWSRVASKGLSDEALMLQVAAAAMREVDAFLEKLRSEKDLSWVPLHLDSMWLFGASGKLKLTDPILHSKWQTCLRELEDKIRTRIEKLRRFVDSNPRLVASVNSEDTKVWEAWLCEAGNIKNILAKQNLLLFDPVVSTINTDARNSMLAVCADIMNKTEPPLPGNDEDVSADSSSEN
jgi:hypothetical protein